jgi:hypothetical protein
MNRDEGGCSPPPPLRMLGVRYHWSDMATVDRDENPYTLAQSWQCRAFSEKMAPSRFFLNHRFSHHESHFFLSKVKNKTQKVKTSPQGN